MDRVLFLDKDGTLVDDAGYPYRIPKDKILVKHTVEGLKKFEKAGYKLLIVSNQSWIANNRMTVDDAEKVFQSVVKQYKDLGVTIHGYAYCPHKPKNACACRKPKPALLGTVSKGLDVDKENSIMVGDKDTDVGAGEAFGVKTCLVLTGTGKENEDKCHPTYVANDVNDLAKIVLEE